MLEELNIMKLNFEVKHRFDFSGTLSKRNTPHKIPGTGTAYWDA
jgi:hypothetical protein